MNKRVLLLLAVLCATASAQINANRQAGHFIATAYQYDLDSVISSGLGGPYTFPTLSCQQALPFSNSRNLNPFNVNASVLVVDANSANTETVAFNSLTTASGYCVLNLAVTLPHTSYHLKSGTYGLQEAINDATLSGGGVVVVDTQWQGTTSMILAAAGNTSVSIEDDRSGLANYSWNGSAYAATAAGVALPVGPVNGGTGTGSPCATANAALRWTGTIINCDPNATLNNGIFQLKSIQTTSVTQPGIIDFTCNGSQDSQAVPANSVGIEAPATCPATGFRYQLSTVAPTLGQILVVTANPAANRWLVNPQSLSTYDTRNYAGADLGVRIQNCLGAVVSGSVCDARAEAPGAMTTVNVDSGAKSWILYLPNGTMTCTGPCFKKASGNTTTRFYMFGGGMSVTTLKGDGTNKIIDFKDWNLSEFHDFTVDMNAAASTDGISVLSNVAGTTTCSQDTFTHVEVRNPGTNSSLLHLLSCSGMVINASNFNGLTSPAGSVGIRLDDANADDMLVDEMSQFHNLFHGIDNTLTVSNPNNCSGYRVASAIFGLDNGADLYSCEKPEEPIVVDYAFTEGSKSFLVTTPGGNGTTPSFMVKGLYVDGITDAGNCAINFTSNAPLTIQDAYFSGLTGTPQKVCLNSANYQSTLIAGGNYKDYVPYVISGAGNSLVVLNSTWGYSGGTGIPHMHDLYGSTAGGQAAQFTNPIGSITITGFHNLTPFANVVISSVTPSPAGGATTWAYKVVFRQAVGGAVTAAQASAAQTTTGPATLNSSNFNIITWSLAGPGMISCLDFYDIYRTTAGGTPNTIGKIASIPACQNTYNDIGAAGDASTAPSVNNTGRAGIQTPSPQTSFHMASDCGTGFSNTSACGLFLGPHNYAPGGFGGLNLWHTDAGNTTENIDSRFNSTSAVMNFRMKVDGTPITPLSLNGAGTVSALNLVATTYASTTNCAAVGTAASPSVASCGSAAAGHFSCATNASGATCQVNTTAVTANSEILVFESDTAATGTALGVTCNTSTNVLPASRLLASSVAATSFTINLGTVTTNPACFSYYLVN